jgi:hypothetical protein
MKMDEVSRRNWLNRLAFRQLKALASQNGIPDWNVIPKKKLVSLLAAIEGIEQPEYRE